MVYRDDRGSHELIGITSWGSGCARRNKPGVYASVRGNFFTGSKRYLIIRVFLTYLLSATQSFWKRIVRQVNGGCLRY